MLLTVVAYAWITVLPLPDTLPPRVSPPNLPPCAQRACTEVGVSVLSGLGCLYRRGEGSKGCSTHLLPISSHVHGCFRTEALPHLDKGRNCNGIRLGPPSSVSVSAVETRSGPVFITRFTVSVALYLYSSKKAL
jgi:hypothetical protein